MLALQDFLLTDGLQAPARPDEIDRLIRETNVPAPDRMLNLAATMPLPLTCPKGHVECVTLVLP
jgi:hypothetical protein